jgi:hypothetical protein
MTPGEQGREELANWTAPDSGMSSPEDGTPQARAAKMIERSKANALKSTDKEGKPSSASYEDRLAVSERNWISQAMKGNQDPEVLKILQQRMAELDQQVPDMQNILHGRAIRDDSLETYRARIENSKKEARALLEQQLPAIESAFADFPQELRINIADDNATITVALDNSPNMALKYQREAGQQQFPGKTEQLEKFLTQAGKIVTTFPKLQGEYSLGLVWHREPNVTVSKLLKGIRSALESAEKVRTPQVM